MVSVMASEEPLKKQKDGGRLAALCTETHSRVHDVVVTVPKPVLRVSPKPILRVSRCSGSMSEARLEEEDHDLQFTNDLRRCP